MTEINRQAFLTRIASGIQSHGYHLTVVDGSPSPRFAYSIGLHQSHGFELVFAGGAAFTTFEVKTLFSEFVTRLRNGEVPDSLQVCIEGMGTFNLGRVDISWSKVMLLGVLDYFELPEVKAYQILPDEDHHTIDVPDMGARFDSETQPMWRWLEQDWSLPFDSNAKAITNLTALRGYAITEVVRWEDSEWEMFSGSGPETPKIEMRIVPLAVLLAFDSTLNPVVNLEIGRGLWRDDLQGEWHPWGKPAQSA